MKEIFTDLYKKVVGFFQSQEKKENENEREIACSRMKLVLMQDRTNLTPLLLERLRGEMIEVLSKYVEMDKEALELNLEQDGDQVALMLSIPVIRAKDEEEIKEALAKEDAKKAEEEAQGDEDAPDEVEIEETEIILDSEALDDDMSDDDYSEEETEEESDDDDKDEE